MHSDNQIQQSENSPRMIICVLFVSFPLLRLSCFCFVNALTDFTRFLSFFMCAISLVINVAHVAAFYNAGIRGACVAHAKRCDGNVAGGVIFLVESNVRPA
jgi:hypothetical protein